MADTALSLEPLDDALLGAGEGAGTPPPDPAAAAPSPFSLEIDERTKYDDPAKAKEGFLNLKQDRDGHKTAAEKLREENARLKLALGGAPPADPAKTKRTLTPQEIEQQRNWLGDVKDPLGLVTREDLDAYLTEKREDEIFQRGDVHVRSLLTEHGIDLSPAKQVALEHAIIAELNHPDNAALKQRLLVNGDMGVLTEMVEDRFAAHIASRKSLTAEEQAAAERARNERGQFAKVQDTKDKMRAKLPNPPPKGGTAALPATAPVAAVAKTTEERRKSLAARLDERIAAKTVAA